MKIVHVVDYLMPEIGYQEYYLPKALSECPGVQSSIVTSDRYTNFENYNDVWGQRLGKRIVGSGVIWDGKLKITRLPIRFEIGLRIFLRGLYSHLKNEAPDFVYVHGTSSISYFLVMLLSIILPFKIVCDNHVLYELQNTKRTIGKKLFYSFLRLFNLIFQSKVTFYFGVEKDCCRQLQLNEGIDVSKIKLLPLGFTPPIAESVSPQALLGGSYSPDIFYILQTGKMSADKGPYLLYEAFKILASRHSSLQLVFCGSGGELERIRRDPEFNSFKNRIIFLNSIPASKLFCLFNLVDLVVFPKGSSLSVYEAAYCGKPVITSPLQVCQDRARLGIGVSVCDNSDLASLIEKFYCDESYRLKVIKRQEKIVGRYNYKNISIQLCEYLER